MKFEQLEPRQLLSTALDGDVLRILTDAGADVIQLSRAGDGSLRVQENLNTYQFDSSLIHKIAISTGAGNDRVQTSGVDIPLDVNLGGGNDTLIAGAGADTIYSGTGNDLVSAGDGNNVVYTDKGTDRVMAGTGNDAVWSGSRTDLVNTGKGHDTVSGKARTVNTGKASVYQPMIDGAAYQPGIFQENVTGYDPNQIRNAYGFGDMDPNAGAGQTIFIVDAFTGLHIQEDFTAFCNQFDLPAPTADNFKIVTASGKTPAIDPLWALETMLDIEWARAIAPAAKIVLVQADSNIDTDMFIALRKAANMAQKVGGVVSMSWGEAPNRIYDPGVAGYTPVTTTAMDQMEKLFHSRSRVTFFAAAGDAGDQAIAAYPAMSPNVTAVGGTVLTLDQDGNPLADETAWFFGGSGYALPDWFERPGYQQGINYYLPDPNYPIQMTPIAADEPVRGIPDVSYNATNFAVYTTTPISGDAGWFSVGGTSAGTPQWAAIAALANQKRAAAGRAPIGNSFNGIAYDVYNGYADLEGANQSYEDNFNDIILGQAGPWFADIGYDMATGIGSPRGEHVVDTLADYTGFFIQRNFTFETHLYLPFSVASVGLFPVGSGQTHTGTGTMLGTDTVSLSFLTDPVPMFGTNFTPVIVPDNYYDIEAGQQSQFRVQLYRTGRGQSSGRIYGKGQADIFNADPKIVTIGTTTPMTFTLNFEGRWWTSKSGQIHFNINYNAIDPVTYQPLESGPAQLRYDPTLPWLGAYMDGSISG